MQENIRGFGRMGCIVRNSLSSAAILKLFFLSLKCYSGIQKCEITWENTNLLYFLIYIYFHYNLSSIREHIIQMNGRIRDMQLKSKREKNTDSVFWYKEQRSVVTITCYESFTQNLFVFAFENGIKPPGDAVFFILTFKRHVLKRRET